MIPCPVTCPRPAMAVTPTRVVDLPLARVTPRVVPIRSPYTFSSVPSVAPVKLV